MRLRNPKGFRLLRCLGRAIPLETGVAPGRGRFSRTLRAESAGCSPDAEGTVAVRRRRVLAILLPGFPVSAMDAATRTELFQLHPIRIVAPVFLRCVRPLPALRACQVDDDAVALCLGHGSVPSVVAFA